MRGDPLQPGGVGDHLPAHGLIRYLSTIALPQSVGLHLHGSGSKCSIQTAPAAERCLGNAAAQAANRIWSALTPLRTQLLPCLS